MEYSLQLGFLISQKISQKQGCSVMPAFFQTPQAFLKLQPDNYSNFIYLTVKLLYAWLSKRKSVSVLYYISVFKKNLFDFCVLISLVFTLFGYLNCLTQC